MSAPRGRPSYPTTPREREKLARFKEFIENLKNPLSVPVEIARYSPQGLDLLPIVRSANPYENKWLWPNVWAYLAFLKKLNALADTTVKQMVIPIILNNTRVERSISNRRAIFGDYKDDPEEKIHEIIRNLRYDSEEKKLRVLKFENDEKKKGLLKADIGSTVRSELLAVYTANPPPGEAFGKKKRKLVDALAVLLQELDVYYPDPVSSSTQ